MILPLEFLFSSLFPIPVLEQTKAGNHSFVEAEPQTTEQMPEPQAVGLLEVPQPGTAHSRAKGSVEISLCCCWASPWARVTARC